MKRRHLLVFIINVIAIMSGCNNRHDYIEKTLQKMQSRPINLCLDKMQCRVRNMDTVIVDSMKPDLRLVVYIDSTECSPCALDRLYKWNGLISEAKKYGGRLKYIFIVAPKRNQLEDVYLSIESSGVDSPVYVDTAYCLRKENNEINSEKMFHVFCLNKNDSVILVGDILDNDRVDSIFRKQIRAQIN